MFNFFSCVECFNCLYSYLLYYVNKLNYAYYRFIMLNKNRPEKQEYRVRESNEFCINELR